MNNEMPKHIAIVMDGNGRWAKKRYLPRFVGHEFGLKSVKETVRNCLVAGVPYLTLFAFSTENWGRPKEEVSFLMELFLKTLNNEVKALHEQGVRIQVVGNKTNLSKEMLVVIDEVQKKTENNQALTLNIAVDYGGKWDILQAINRIVEHNIADVSETVLEKYLLFSGIPDPDLFIRTGGEKRISNFMLWYLAYTELYFTETLWPDFDKKEFDLAIASYQTRERRFGQVKE